MADEIRSKLHADIRNHVLSILPRDPSHDAELNSRSTADLLITYINWVQRFPTIRPRSVLESREIRANPLRVSTEYEARYRELVEKIERGDDLTDRLSHRVKIGYKRPTKGKFNKKREDLDLLLNDLHVHHLHFAPSGTKMLLFAAFAGDVAYLINIYDHKSWTKDEIATILIDNWPESEWVHEFRSLVPSGSPCSDQERALLRNNGIVAPFIERNGKMFMVGIGGVTGAGTSLFATRQALWLMRTIETWNKSAEDDPEFLAKWIRSGGKEPSETLEIEFLFMRNQHFGIGERNSGVYTRLTEGLE